MEQRILGIDPGSVITGWGVIDHDGSRIYHVDNGGIFTRNKEFHQRLKEIFERTGVSDGQLFDELDQAERKILQLSKRKMTAQPRP